MKMAAEEKDAWNWDFEGDVSKDKVKVMAIGVGYRGEKNIKELKRVLVGLSTWILRAKEGIGEEYNHSDVWVFNEKEEMNNGKPESGRRGVVQFDAINSKLKSHFFKKDFSNH